MRRRLTTTWGVGLAIGLATASLGAQPPSLVQQVLAAIARGDVGGAERLVDADRAVRGDTPANLAAHSWLGRGALAAGHVERAEGYAQTTYDRTRAALTTAALDGDPQLQTALGAAIEVLAQAAAARGQRSEAVAFLRGELTRYRNTAVHARIQKNLHLLSLEGTAAPALDIGEHIGPRPPTLAALRGHVVLLFFWAHWCSDCKAQLPLVAELSRRYGLRGLRVVAPTQRYGYVEAGRPASPQEEKDYIARVRSTAYAALGTTPTPLSAESHRQYGVSSTPTLVLVDRKGLVRMYRPGQVDMDTLTPVVERLLAEQR